MSEPFQHSNYTQKGKIEISNIIEDGKYILGSEDKYTITFTSTRRKEFELKLQLTDEGIKIIKNTVKDE